MGRGGIASSPPSCPLCGGKAIAAAELRACEYGANGLPVACATTPGWGLPLMPNGLRVCVLLDGEPVNEAVAYSVRDGWVGAALTRPDGSLIERRGRIVFGKRQGRVSVEAIADDDRPTPPVHEAAQ